MLAPSGLVLDAVAANSEVAVERPESVQHVERDLHLAFIAYIEEAATKGDVGNWVCRYCDTGT